MNNRTLAKPQNNNSPTFSPVFDKKLSSRNFIPQPANEARDVSNPEFGHNFGDIQVESQSLKQPCPLALSGPSHCPFGGACHTCPPRIQAKLKIGQPGDKYEQEADRVAEQVMRMPEPQVQRKAPSPCNEIDDEELIQAKPVAGRITPLVQRQVEEEEEEENLQTKEVSGQTPGVAQDVQTHINNLSGTGKPLPESERFFFEQRFGYDFSPVRVHSGSQAARLTRAVNARAFTVGRDLMFGAGQFAPETSTGRHLLSHELTHVLQHKKSKEVCLQRQKKKNRDPRRLPENVGGGLVPIAFDKSEKPLCNTKQIQQIRDAYASGYRALRKARLELGKLRTLVKKEPGWIDAKISPSEGLRQFFGLPQKVSKMDKVEQIKINIFIEIIYNNLHSMMNKIGTFRGKGNELLHLCPDHGFQKCEIDEIEGGNRWAYYQPDVTGRQVKASIVFCESFFKLNQEKQQLRLLHELAHASFLTYPDARYNLYIPAWEPKWPHSWAVADSYAHFIMYVGKERRGFTKLRAGFDECPDKWKAELLFALWRAEKWINTTLLKVLAILVNPKRSDDWTRRQLTKHFKILGGTGSLQQVREVYQDLKEIWTAFRSGVPFECEEECDSYQVAKEHGIGDIRICPLWRDIDPGEQSIVILHEMAHKYGGKEDKAYYKYDSNYYKLETEDLLTNADSFAWFSRQVGSK